MEWADSTANVAYWSATPSSNWMVTTVWVAAAAVGDTATAKPTASPVAASIVTIRTLGNFINYQLPTLCQAKASGDAAVRSIAGSVFGNDSTLSLKTAP